ncbi:unnamed protein product, partial [Menidia menidia]
NLSEMYTSELGGSKTEAYLSDFKKIVKMSRTDYGAVLGQMIFQINQFIAAQYPADFVSQRRRSIAPRDFNPPEMQCCALEPAVRLHANPQLISFSGKVLRGTHEMDYTNWNSGVKKVLHDPSGSDVRCTRLIHDSLLLKCWPISLMIQYLMFNCDIWIQPMELLWKVMNCLLD